MLNKATKRAYIFICLLDHAYEGLLANIKMELPSKAFNMREVWNPVCCHGNRTVKLVLWSTFIRILKESNISDTNWLRSLFIIFEENLVECMT